MYGLGLVTVFGTSTIAVACCCSQISFLCSIGNAVKKVYITSDTGNNQQPKTLALKKLNTNVYDSSPSSSRSSSTEDNNEIFNDRPIIAFQGFNPVNSARGDASNGWLPTKQMMQ